MSRHYVDRLVQYSTGRERAAAMTAKYAYALKRQKFRWTAGLTMATDVQYYNHLKFFGQASVATVAMLANKGKLSRVWTPRVRFCTSQHIVLVDSTACPETAASSSSLSNPAVLS